MIFVYRQFLYLLKIILFRPVPLFEDNNRILLIRMDAIGDYILFRNYIKLLAESKRFHGKKITFVANSSWMDIANMLDATYIDKFIWIDRRKYQRNLIYRYKKLKIISSNSYEAVISPVYSRDFFYSDWVSYIVSAKEKICSAGDNSNMTAIQRKISSTWFTTVVPVKPDIMFEFNRNKEFFEYVLGEKLAISKPGIVLERNMQKSRLPKNYAVLFIGAGEKYRKWPIESFVQIAQLLKKKYGFEIVLCGGADDQDESSIFSTKFNGEYSDLVGKTNLVELMYVISNCGLILSNETSVPHMAVALNVRNIFVIYNGKHFGRFTPYPSVITTDYHVIFHPVIESEINSSCKLSHDYGDGSKLDINNISIDLVENRISSILSSVEPA